MHAYPACTEVDEYLKQSAMVKLTKEFDSLATGRIQVPRQVVTTRIREHIADADVLAYHDFLVPRVGPLFAHFLASIPGILEEMSRVGVALTRLAKRYAVTEGKPYLFYELDAFDGSNGRTLAAFAEGRIKTLTCSPNKANEKYFYRFADRERSKFISSSFLKIDSQVLQQASIDADFQNGFDTIYETAAFQFYGKDREFQIKHIAPLLKNDGLAFFLEKLAHPDMREYERREHTKDNLHKTHYFTADEIEWKRQQMLLHMRDGEVTFAELVNAISQSFKYCYLLWNSTNFYEFVACNNESRIEEFISLLGDLWIEEHFVFERPMPRKVLAHGR